MGAPIIELCILQGKTLEFALQYAEDHFTYCDIVAVPSLVPVQLSVPSHGIPDGWPVTIQCVRRPDELNGDYLATVIDDDTIEINDLVGSCWRHQWSAGGHVRYPTPQDITGWSARATLRRRVGDDSAVLTFHSDPAQNPDGLIIVDPAEHSFTLKLDEAAAKQLQPMVGVWDAEVIDPAGNVFALVGVSPFEIAAEVTE